MIVILFTSFLLNTFYKCDVAQGKVLSGRYENVIENERNVPSKTADGRQQTVQNLLSLPMEEVDKNVLFKSIWDALTPEEIMIIFNYQQTSSTSSLPSKSMPNFDITKPKLTHLPQNRDQETGKPSSVRNPSFTKENESDYKTKKYSERNRRLDQSPTKLIQLDGFGRRFILNVYPSQMLLHPNFVHIHRHENRSEIITTKVVHKQVGCFYHGSASHQEENEYSNIQIGAAALNLCGGMVRQNALKSCECGLNNFTTILVSVVVLLMTQQKGIILPSGTRRDNDRHNFHYVIHPLPNRLFKTEKSPDRENNASASEENGVHDRHHIIFKRTGNLFSKLATNQRHTIQTAINAKRETQTIYRHYTNRRKRNSGVLRDEWKLSLNTGVAWSDPLEETDKQTGIDISNLKYGSPFYLTIEMAVFVDKDLYKHIQQHFPNDTQKEVTRFVLAIMNGVQLLYQDPSLGYRVDIVLKRLEILKNDPPSLIRSFDIDRLLNDFCKWQERVNTNLAGDPLHWDHALLLTGLDLYAARQTGQISNQVVGRAPIAGMCSRSASFTVSEGRNFEAIFVIAREIGHNLGMRDDGFKLGNNSYPIGHIMSPKGWGFNWSACSKKYLELFLQTEQAKCLVNKAKPEGWLDHDVYAMLPGERFDADRQCKLKYGQTSFHATNQPLQDICRHLHCRRGFSTWTAHPALDGTKCSASDEMWCRAGKCVSKPTHLSPSSTNSNSSSGHRNEAASNVTQNEEDSVSDKWSHFTGFPSACFYSKNGTLKLVSRGVKAASRRCDGPRSKNGERKCNGPDMRYETYSVYKICTRTPTRRTVSQFATAVCSRAAQVDAELTGRGHMSSSNDLEKACSVWCERNNKLEPRISGWSFPNGTKCSLLSLPESAQTYCVAGKCQEFTCSPHSKFRLTENYCLPRKGHIK